MKLYIFSDIHSNDANLEKILLNMHKKSPKALKLCLGDTVGYSGDVNRCFDLLKRFQVICVIGNHDQEAIVGYLNTEKLLFLSENGKVLPYDYGISHKNKQFLKAMPKELTMQICGRSMYFSHGSLKPSHISPVEISIENALDFLSYSNCDLNFIGGKHYHEIIKIRKGHETALEVFQPRKTMAIHIDQQHRYIFNVGAACRDNYIFFDVPYSMATFVVG
ncbi:MAG: metallophosphoesterase family protein [Candidatus Woesearchaeota archaeon]